MAASATAAPAASRTAAIFFISAFPLRSGLAAIARSGTRRKPLRRTRSGEQRFHRPPIAGQQSFSLPMTASTHHLLPGPPHAVDHLAPGGEYPTVENLVFAALDERGVTDIESHQIERGIGDEP